MKLSIIVPIYKVEAYLDQCVQSILDQTFTDFELILVDDGSPDRCPKLCDEWAERDSRIKVIHKENGGPQSAVICGTKQAKGTYVGYVDGDDWIAGDYFEKLASAMELHDADMVAAGWTVHDGDVPLGVYMLPDGGVLDKHQIEQSVLQPFWEDHGNLFLGNCRWSKIWRRELLCPVLDMLDISLSMGEDLEQLLRYLPVCTKMVLLPDYVGYYYRKREESITRGFSDKIVRQYMDLKDILKEIALEQGREYRSRKKREVHLNFSCFDQLFTSRQTIRQYIQYVKKILGDGPVTAPENVSPVFKIGFWLMRKRYFVLGCVCLRILYVLNRAIYK